MPILFLDMLLDRDQMQTSGHLEVCLIRYPPILKDQKLNLVPILDFFEISIRKSLFRCRRFKLNAKPSCWVIV